MQQILTWGVTVILASDVDDLHDDNAGQGAAQIPIAARHQLVDELQGVGAAAALLRDDFVGVLAGRQQKRGDGRRHLLGNLANQFFRNRTRPTRHRRDKAKRRRAVGDGRPGFVQAADAANLDMGCDGREHESTGLLAIEVREDDLLCERRYALN